MSLFSRNQEKVLASYKKISKETDLDQEINPYYYELKKIHGEVAKMYTRENYIRDYGDNTGKLYWLPWEQEFIDKLQKDAKEELEAVEKEAKEKLKASEKEVKKEAKRGELRGQIKTHKQL